MKAEQTAPFGVRDKLGYMAGDLGNNVAFQLQSSFLMLFYTDVLQIPAGMAGTMFLVARIFDAVTDVLVGHIIDKRPTTREGKYRPWLRKMSGFLALMTFLIFQSGMQDASMTVKVVYMWVTYLLWGSVFYTSVNIPYGSMAGVISPNPSDRSALSTFRTLGASTANLFIGVGVPLIIYHEVGGHQVVKTDATFTVVAGVAALISFTALMVCYRLTTERVKIPMSDGPQESFFKTVRKLLQNRALVGVIIASLGMLMATTTIGQTNNYVYARVYNSTIGVSASNLINQILTLTITAPLGLALARKFGKKEITSVGMLLAGVMFFVLWLIGPRSIYIHIAFVAVVYILYGFYYSQVWAMIPDVVDDIQLTTGNRDGGTVYALNSFARKIGQAISGALVGWSLSYIGYDAQQVELSSQVQDGIFTMSTLIPAGAFLLAAISLLFIYPLNRERVEENNQQLHL